MPRFEATVEDAKQVWASPDGQRTISEVTLNVDGQIVTAKSYSKAFTKGWTGEIESYEKPGRNGPETFVKQVPKENPQFGSSAPQSSGGTNVRSGKTVKDFDNFTMYLSYAKDVAVALIGSGDYNQMKLADILNDVAVGGEQLFDAHNNKDVVSEPPKDTLNDLFSGDLGSIEDDPFAGIPVVPDR